MMIISHPNWTHYYDFKVEQNNNSSDQCCYDPTEDFTINFRFRKLNGRDVEFDVRRSIQIPRTSQRFEPFIWDLLAEYEVPDSAVSDMAEHFKFNLERFNRMRRGGVTVAVILVAKLMTPDLARRINAERSGNNVSRGVRRVVDETVVTIPAKKAAVEALERVLLSGDDDRECSICLEGFVEGVEVIKMPCLHVYHSKCIVRWLDKNHFCPFCRFELPC